MKGHPLAMVACLPVFGWRMEDVVIDFSSSGRAPP